MCTDEEIRETQNDYRLGRNGFENAHIWNSFVAYEEDYGVSTWEAFLPELDKIYIWKGVQILPYFKYILNIIGRARSSNRLQPTGRAPQALEFAINLLQAMEMSLKYITSKKYSRWVRAS